MKKKTSKYQVSINIVMAIWTLIIILPFILLFMSSITDENTLVANGYSFFPKKFSAAAYIYIIRSGSKILKAYGVSILVTLVGTLVNIFLSAMMAYPLTVKNLPGRKFLMFLYFSPCCSTVVSYRPTSCGAEPSILKIPSSHSCSPTCCSVPGM